MTPPGCAPRVKSMEGALDAKKDRGSELHRRIRLWALSGDEEESPDG